MMNAALKLYRIDLQTDSSPELFSMLSAAERHFAHSIRTDKFKKQYIRVRAGVRQILSEFLNQSPDQINIAKTLYGKPYLSDYPAIQFNISHSGEVLLVAVSATGAVGIDIEQAKPQRQNFSGVAAKCFAASELHYWQHLPESEQAAEFYRFWTRKEAFVKAVGRGLAMGLHSCVIAPSQPPYFLSLPPEYGLPSDWRLFDLALNVGLYGALVLENRKIPLDFCLPAIQRMTPSLH